ncbi:MAG: hypothetical protein JWL72_3400 [Ilumatobacteraceae bacterium]|nr:hypothetical protein [Ilumatobacteraceae bacterium]
MGLGGARWPHGIPPSAGRRVCFTSVVDVITNGTEVFADVEEFLRRFAATKPKRRSRLALAAPVAGIQLAALHHPNAFARRACLGFLDHYSSDCSVAVFARALADPVEPVRHIALHSIACERCRTDDLCASDVVPLLADILRHDPSPEIRHKTIPVLLRLSDRDSSARDAVERSTHEDADELIRDVATRALAGEHIRSRKMYERHARNHRD